MTKIRMAAVFAGGILLFGSPGAGLGSTSSPD